jgi:hypothetical protein
MRASAALQSPSSAAFRKERASASPSSPTSFAAQSRALIRRAFWSPTLAPSVAGVPVLPCYAGATRRRGTRRTPRERPHGTMRIRGLHGKRQKAAEGFPSLRSPSRDPVECYIPQSGGALALPALPPPETRRSAGADGHSATLVRDVYGMSPFSGCQPHEAPHRPATSAARTYPEATVRGFVPFALRTAIPGSRCR